MKKYYKYTLKDHVIIPTIFYPGGKATFNRQLVDSNGTLWAVLTDKGLCIAKGYSWDGCSPKYKLQGSYLGTWDGVTTHHVVRTMTGISECPPIVTTQKVDIAQQMKYASLVHDVLYQFYDQVFDLVPKEYADYTFLVHAKATRFPLARLYYLAVKYFGTLMTGGRVC